MIRPEFHHHFLRSFINSERTPFPTTIEGYLRSDLRALLADALGNANNVNERNAYHEVIVDREWSRFTEREKDSITQGVLEQLRQGAIMSEWMVDLLMRTDRLEIQAQVFKSITKIESKPGRYEFTRVTSFMRILQELPMASALLEEVLTSLATSLLLSDIDIYKSGRFTTDDAILILKKLKHLQLDHADDYNTVVQLMITGIMSYGSDPMVICQFIQAGIPFDSISCLSTTARNSEEAWPAILKLMGNLSTVSVRVESKNSGYARTANTKWDPSWHDPVLAGAISAAFMGWMEKKRNRNPRAIFAGNYLQQLARNPEITTIVPDFHSRAIFLWRKNLCASDPCGAAKTLVSLWPGLSDVDKNASLLLLSKMVIPPANGFSSTACHEKFLILEILGACDLPDTWLDSLLESASVDVEKGHIAASHLPGLAVLARTTTGSALAAKGLVSLFERSYKNDVKRASSIIDFHSYMTSSVCPLMLSLAHPLNSKLISVLKEHNRLHEVMTLATMSFLAARSIAYRPKNEALVAYAVLLKVLGVNDFMAKFDIYYDVDIGRHGFASLLAALSPEGGALWSTAEALYMDNILDGTLVTCVEIRDMINELIREVFMPRQHNVDSSIYLPELFV
jgi:hypothetical protein